MRTKPMERFLEMHMRIDDPAKKGATARG